MSNLATYNGCFQKPNRFPQFMLKPRQVLIGIILILGISFSPLINSDALVPKVTIDSSNELTSIEHLPASVSNWNQISGESNNGFPINDLSGEFNLAHGSFDPLTDELPPLPDSFIDDNDFAVTGMKFVQLYDYDYRWLNQLEEKGYLSIF